MASRKNTNCLLNPSSQVMTIFQTICILIALFQKDVAFAKRIYHDITMDANTEMGDSDSGRLLFRSLSPRDMGALHNQIVMQVHDRIADAPPLNHDEYSRIVYEEVITTCDEMDHECREQVHHNIERGKVEVKEFLEKGYSFDIHSIFPDDVDADLKYHFLSIVDAVRLLTDHPLEEVLDILNDISNKVEMTDTHKINKQAVQMVSSIAMGSAELWYNVRNDPNNAFHKLHTTGSESGSYDNNNHHHRHLQTLVSSIITNSFGVNPMTNIVGFVLSDVLGAVKGVVVPLIFFTIGVGKPTLVLENSVRLSISDSLMAIGIRIPTPGDIVLCALSLNITSCDYYNFLN